MPANRDEAVGHLVSDGFADNNGNMAGDKDFDEAQAWENAWQAMDKFIEQDAYLSNTAASTPSTTAPWHPSPISST